MNYYKSTQNSKKEPTISQNVTRGANSCDSIVITIWESTPAKKLN